MRVYLRTFGCRANQYDTEQVRAMLVADGHEIVTSPETADAAVFNSCAVTSDAEADLRQSVRRAARTRPSLRTVIMGCAAARDGGQLRALPGVEHIVSGGEVHAVAAALGVRARGMAHAQTGTRAVLRIQDGCDEHCTFCATTLARGANRSRPIGELCEEALALSEHHAEIVITGIHIGTYGRDRDSSLGALMHALVGRVPAVRFRLSSIEATEVDDALRELFDEPLRVAPYLHAPLQSGSDRILKRMGRHWYSSSSYARSIERVAGERSVFGLGADVIAGFPGETEEDHAATMALVERLPFTSLHVFPYSVRPGTAAERLGDHVPSATIKRRASELRALAAEKARAYASARAGGTADVLVEGGSGHRVALTGDYLSVGLANQSLPRGTRFSARLEALKGGLRAVEDAAGTMPVAELTQDAGRRTQKVFGVAVPISAEFTQNAERRTQIS